MSPGPDLRPLGEVLRPSWKTGTSAGGTVNFLTVARPCRPGAEEPMQRQRQAYRQAGKPSDPDAA